MAPIYGIGNGYVRYRYGDRKAKPVARLPETVTKGFVSAVMDTLKDWRFSPFEHEGDTRRAVRNWFISRGHGWPLSDAEADALICRAFDAMEIKRPSWLEGQWVYTASRHQCIWCAGEIEEADQLRGMRFCSGMCAKLSLEKRVRDQKTAGDWIYQRAHMELANSLAQERQCKHCSETFKSRYKDREYCSTRCHDAARRAPDIACHWCGDMFHPKDRHKKYCSKECANKGFLKTREASLPPEKSCGCCLTIFRPKVSFAVYCSPRCTRIMANRFYRARRAPARVVKFPLLTPAIFDGWFRIAA